MSYTYKPKLTGDTATMNRLMKEAVRRKVYYSVKTGKLQKESCEYADCNSSDSQAHHPDYSYPLDVIWLCKVHHRELHKNIGYTLVSRNWKLQQ